MATTTERPAVDISDRGAAIDRYARLAIVDQLLREIRGLGESDERMPDWRDRSDAANAERRSLDWLGDLPDDFSLDATDTDDPLGEMHRIHNALFAHDIPDADGNSDPEYDLANARTKAMTARLLIRLANNPELLQRRAVELLLEADEGMEEASTAMAELQEWFEKRADTDA